MKSVVHLLLSNVFLDHDLDLAAIEHQFKRLVNLAKRCGYALAIGHPFNVTLDFPEQKLPELTHNGIHLIPVSKLIQAQQAQEKLTETQQRSTPT